VFLSSNADNLIKLKCHRVLTQQKRLVQTLFSCFSSKGGVASPRSCFCINGRQLRRPPTGADGEPHKSPVLSPTGTTGDTSPDKTAPPSSGGQKISMF
jgi:hypothetical protein